MIVKILLIFIAGLILDLLGTKYTRYVAEKKTGGAVLLTGIITIVNFFLLTVILKDAANSGFYNIIAFAGGNSVGTFLAMKKR